MARRTEFIYPCPDCHTTTELVNDGDGTYKCAPCWVKYHERRTQEEALAAVLAAGLTPACLEQTFEDHYKRLTLPAQLAAFRLKVWTQRGGGCYFFGPTTLRDTIARTAAAELWRSGCSELRLLTEAEFIDAYIRGDEGLRRELARIPWLILLDVGMHTATRGPGRAMFWLLRQRYLSRHAKGTLFVSHLPPAHEIRLLLASLDEASHAKDTFIQLFRAQLVCTTGGAASQSHILLELTSDDPRLKELP